MSYADFANRSRSEKIVLCWVEPSTRLLLWTLDSGAIYTRAESNFIVDIFESTTSLVEAASASLNSGEWYYDLESGILYVRTSDDSNPNTKDIVATIRLAYATAPIDLPYDLVSGGDIHYEGVLKTNSAITKALDDEQTGIALESNTSVSFDNTAGTFDSIYDAIFFENKRIRLYSWSDSIPLSEKQLIFDGTIQNKSFTSKDIKFKCKDFVYKLREPLPLDTFKVGDGTISETYLYTPKRRIYGQVDKARCVPVDSILDGHSLTGTVTGDFDSLIITGTGTAFLDECTPGDSLTVTLLNEVLELDIESVDSDTQITLGDEIPTAFSAETISNLPARPWRKKNRLWHIAGHKLRAPSTTVASAAQPNRFTVVDGTDLEDGDLINVDGENVFIKRITGNVVVLETNLQAGTPSVSDAVNKSAVSNAYIGSKEVFIDRDWSITNTTEAILVLDDEAELNVATPRKIEGTTTFTNGSRTVTSSGNTLDINIQPRDWVRSSDITHTTYYEVLSVLNGSLELRVAYAGGNIADTLAKHKAVELVGDDTVVAASCVGMESSGVWMKTASDAVNNMVSGDAGLTINASSFADAKIFAPYKLSIIIPEVIGGKIPKIRDVISKINDSVIGSLINNGDWELVYNILTPDRPTDLTAIEDHDIIGEIKVKSSNKIVRKINAQYSPFVDIFTGEDSFKLIEYTNEFVDSYIGTKEEKDVTLYLYDELHAQELAERYALYNSLSQSVVSVKAKLGFMLNNLNDKIYLNLDRLYKRFGSNDRRKIGIISKITKNGSDTNVEFSDLGNIFNRVFAIADNTSDDFTNADDGEKIVNGYVLDNSLEIPDTTDETYLGAGIIG